MRDEIWVLGATGRTGRAVAARLCAGGHPVVLVGRSRERLAGLAADLGGTPRILAGSLEAVLADLVHSGAAAVVNTVGPFVETAARVAQACPPGTHYVDVSNELDALQAIIDLDQHARDGGRTFVAGAGFGVLATESVLLKLCVGEPAPSRVRVDAVASVATEPGVVGTALASTILGGLSSGGKRVEHGRLTRTPLVTDSLHLTTPDGDAVVSGSAPTGELLAAWRASGADSVVAASALVPTGRAARLALPAVAALLRAPGVARFAVRRLARVSTKASPRPRQHSWGHARVEWPSGASRQGWLKAGDAMDFTVAVAAEVAMRLVRSEGRPGSFTPGALFGPELAVVAGGEFLLEAAAAARG